MRMLVFFDLPVKTKEQRRAATRFRNFLLGDGYYMVQFSVYARICCGMDSVESHRQRLHRAVPPHGSVRLLVITEKQYTIGSTNQNVLVRSIANVATRLTKTEINEETLNRVKF